MKTMVGGENEEDNSKGKKADPGDEPMWKQVLKRLSYSLCSFYVLVVLVLIVFVQIFFTD